MSFGMFTPHGAEDVPWWPSNTLRVDVQRALGIIGPLSLIAGGVQPVALVEDLSRLAETFKVFWFGGIVGTPIPVGFLPGMEIHAPASGNVDVFVHRLGWATIPISTARKYVQIRSPSPATDLALLTANTTELDEGFQALHQTHACRVFMGSNAPGAAIIGIGNHQLRGLVSIGSDNKPDHTIMDFPGGYRIPRGRNMVLGNDYEAGGGSAPTMFWCVVSETQAPGGPA